MNDSLKLRQCNEIVVEAALRSITEQEEGRPLSARSWSHLLAAADAYLTMAQISERQHHQVTPYEIEITHGLEIRVRVDAEPSAGHWSLQTSALNGAAADDNLFGVEPARSVQTDRVTGELDEAMIEEFGATSTDVYHVLAALVQWNRFDGMQNVAWASEDEILMWVNESIAEPEPGQLVRLAAALRLLTSTQTTLRGPWQPWQTRTRRNRLLVQPLVGREAGMYLIAPHFLEGTLSVYHNYLTQGMLPWSESVSSRLTRALASVRMHRNSDFEKVVAQSLRDKGFEVIERVKPGDGRRLGVPTLTTEVDMVAGRAGESTIWLIEAKDPASVHGIPETARQLRSFFRDSESKGKVKPCYATQLARKEAEIGDYLPDVADKLGLPALSRISDLRLKTIFVTRSITPAAFVRERFPVLTLEEFMRRVDA